MFPKSNPNHRSYLRVMTGTEDRRSDPNHGASLFYCLNIIPGHPHGKLPELDTGYIRNPELPRQGHQFPEGQPGLLRVIRESAYGHETDDPDARKASQVPEEFPGFAHTDTGF